MVKIEITGDDAYEALNDLHALSAAAKSNPAKTTPTPSTPASPTAAPMPTSPAAPATPIPAAVSIPAAPVPCAPMPSAAPTTPAVPVAPAPTYTFEQVGKAGADLVAANPGMMPTLMTLMQKYGVQLVTDLKPEQLGPFALELRGLGAGI